jgi:hypothetical protein
LIQDEIILSKKPRTNSIEKEAGIDHNLLKAELSYSEDLGHSLRVPKKVSIHKQNTLYFSCNAVCGYLVKR